MSTAFLPSYLRSGLLLAFMLGLRAPAGLAQTAPPAAYTFVEQMPSFRGPDTDSLAYYIQRSIRYPAVALQQRLSGRVFVHFVVDAQGRVEDVQLTKGLHPALDAEALRVVAALPAWQQPGRQGGQPVRVALTVPVVFQLQAAVGGTRPYAGPWFPGGPDSLRHFLAVGARRTDYKLRGRWLVRFALDDRSYPLWATAALVMSEAEFKETDPDVLNATRQLLRQMPPWRRAPTAEPPAITLPIYFGQGAADAALAYADFMPVFAGAGPTAAGLAQLVQASLRPAQQGKARVYVEVSETGRLENAQVLQATRPALATAVLQAVQQLPPALAPAQLNGRAVRVFYVLDLEL